MRRPRHDPVGIGGPGALADPRPRAPRPVRTALVAAAVLVMVVAWVRYLPLEGGPATSCPEGAEATPAGQLTAADREAFGERSGLCLVRNVNTSETTVTAVVRNDGPVAAHVTGVRLDGVRGLFDVEGGRLGPGDASRGEPLDGSPRVPGDSERTLAVTFSLPACEQVEQSRVVTFDELPVRVRLLGLPRDLDLPLDPVLRVQSEACPQS